jgi:MFS family permease
MKFTGQQLISGGVIVIVAAAALLGLDLPPAFSYIALALIGLGCSPIYPSMMQLAPERFGEENSSKIISLQMAAAYMGPVIMPPLLGVVAARVDMIAVPVALILYAAIMFYLTERTERRVKASKENGEKSIGCGIVQVTFEERLTANDANRTNRDSHTGAQRHGDSRITLPSTIISALKAKSIISNKPGPNCLWIFMVIGTTIPTISFSVIL